MVDHTATARIQRLVRWLEHFKSCFGHRAQLMALRTYVQGVFSDSERKSMQAMLARVTEPVAYQAFQHFITHAPWDADRVWRRLRAVLPERHGIFILDGTSFPKQGTASVGVARQYCGALGKIANCQVAVPGRVIAVADKAQQRLCRRFRKLAAEHKPAPQIAVAIARELAGFLWAALQCEPATVQ